MTTDEIAVAIKQMYEKQQDLNDLASQRQIEEQALVVEYKVDECNQKRSDIALRYKSLQDSIIADIQTLKNQLSQK